MLLLKEELLLVLLLELLLLELNDDDDDDDGGVGFDPNVDCSVRSVARACSVVASLSSLRSCALLLASDAASLAALLPALDTVRSLGRPLSDMHDDSVVDEDDCRVVLLLVPCLPEAPAPGFLHQLPCRSTSLSLLPLA